MTGVSIQTFFHFSEH